MTASIFPLVRFVSGLGLGEDPEADSAIEGLLNRSSLMDVPFRGMQDQHLLVYLASLEDPSSAEDTVSDINMQSYAGFNMLDAGYLSYGNTADEVRGRSRPGCRVTSKCFDFASSPGWFTLNVRIVVPCERMLQYLLK